MLALKGKNIRTEFVLGSSIVAGNEVCLPQIKVGGNLQRKIAQIIGDCLGALGELTRLGRIVRLPEMGAHVDGDPAQAPRIIERGGQLLGLAKVCEDCVQFAQRNERVAKVEAEIDLPLLRASALGKPGESDQCLLEPRDRFPIGGVSLSLGPGRSEIRDGLGPYLTEESVTSEYDGPELEIGFNAQYLLDFLRAIPQDRVSFELKDQKSAGEMRPAGESTPEEYRYVVMPMRI